MKGAVFVAIVAAIGNFLQGWDNATIAGSVMYIKEEFNLQTSPTMEGLIVATSLIGATTITFCSGSVADWLGRRPMLIMSSILYFLSSLVMLWAPNIYTLLVARLLDGFGIGLAVTLVPLYISETAPPETRGQLNTLPQFTGSAGMFLSYCMVFAMSLTDTPSWRLMLGVLSIPSFLYFLLAIFFLPESPRWLVGKGQMQEAKKVLQRLRGRDDVSGEMALLVEGMGTGGESSIEEYIIEPDNELNGSLEHEVDNDHIKLYGAEEGQSWIARPVRGQSTLAMSRQGSVSNTSVPLMDPMVTLFGSVHENMADGRGSTRSMLFSNFGSMFSVVEQQVKEEPWDEEAQDFPDNESSDSGNESDDHLRSPLLSRQSTADKDATEQVGSLGIGGGWQLAYRKDERAGGGLKKIYLRQEGAGPGSRRGSILSLSGNVDPAVEGESIHAAALVSRSVLCLEDVKGPNSISEVLDKPRKSPVRAGPSLRDLCAPGVKQALCVGIGIQILQQFSGINGVLYYTPQILQKAGVGVLLANLGLKSDSASLLISGLTTLLMLPSIGLAMRLMDVAGRRTLLLTTLPVLVASLVILVIGETCSLSETLHAVISTVSVVVYFCFFVMGFGPIPNILCAEIFPTRVRGLCIAICALIFWICDIIVTYSLPALLASINLRGVFGIYAIVCTIAWFFVFLKVPETKGMPLEVITEFFAVGARQQTAAAEH